MPNRTTRRDLLALTGASLIIPALGAQEQESPSTTSVPELVVFNARVFTVDPRQPRAEAFAIKNGRFLAVGSSADVRNLIRPGDQAFFGTSLLGGMVDVATVIAPASDLLTAEKIGVRTAEVAVLLALASNAALKAVLAAATGTWAFVLRVTAAYLVWGVAAFAGLWIG